MDAVDVAIIGAGVIGAAVFQHLTARGRSCVLLDRRPRTGGETTERNSGVIHAGLWYPADALKTRLCVEGNPLLYAWAEAHGVAHARTTKLVVAADAEEEAALEPIVAHGRACGVPALSVVSGEALARLAPEVSGRAAILCGTTGIVDPAELTASLVAHGAQAGGLVVTGAAVRGLVHAGRWQLDTTRGPLAAEAVVNAAGLYADDVARLAGVEVPRIHPCRGDYYRLTPRTSYRRLVYPVKKQGAPGLGVHLTLGLDGSCRLGPDAHYVSAKDDYGGGGGREAEFAAAAARILRGVTAADVRYESCGIRPKLRGPHDAAERDFVIALDRPGLVDLVGIESPGLTSALAIAREVGRLLLG